MHDNELIFRHGDRPPFHMAFLVAFQHVLACFVAIIAPTIIVTGALELQNEAPYLISLALLVSGISTLIYLGLAVLFLITLEMRIKRRRALRALQELRALAHVIDMHQLSKDPQWYEHRESSPWDRESEHMDPYLLGRYLDYCVDLLALIGKLAALYAQNSQDGVVLQAVEEVENLTSTLATKIWQKIMLIDTLQAGLGGKVR